MEKESPEIRLSEAAASALETARSLQGVLGRSASRHRFEYGWCKTDHKDGRRIRREFRDEDYLFDEPYASSVASMLDKLGLPEPKKGQVFRGTKHDLLFIDTHGVVLRIGPTEVEDLVNPAILQPLGWLQDDANKIRLGDRDRPLTVAIYPGVEIYDHYLKQRNAPEQAGSLRQVMRQTEQDNCDAEGEGNTGIVRVKDDDGVTKAVRVVIDTDNEWNSTSRDEGLRRKREMERLSILVRQAGLSMDAVVGASLGSMFDSVALPWHYAQAAHQPLRNLFWRSFNSQHLNEAMPDAGRRDAFWHACSLAARKPVQLPSSIWQAEKNADGSTTLSCREVMMDVRLYKPWTGFKSDRPGFQGWHPEEMARVLQNALKAIGYMLPDAIAYIKDKLAPPVQTTPASKPSQPAPRPSVTSA